MPLIKGYLRDARQLHHGLWLTSRLSVIILFRSACEKEINEGTKIEERILKGVLEPGLAHVKGNFVRVK